MKQFIKLNTVTNAPLKSQILWVNPYQIALLTWSVESKGTTLGLIGNPAQYLVQETPEQIIVLMDRVL